MNIKPLSLKLILGVIYLTIIIIGLYFLFSIIDIKDLTSLEFIRSNQDIILEYKNENFLFLSVKFSFFFIILANASSEIIIFKFLISMSIKVYEIKSFKSSSRIFLSKFSLITSDSILDLLR